MEDKDKREYEFNGGENGIIQQLASAMSFVGIMTIIVGVLTGISGFIQVSQPRGGGQGFASIVQGVLFLVIGLMTQGASSHFSQVVKTEGNDIGHLMQALDKLRGMYVLQKILFIIVLVLLVLAVFLLMSR
jgi:hypothetical protein